ncbi:MAG: MASE1 domain-containing protein [Terriglobales bacterium]
MNSVRDRVPWSEANLNSPLHSAILVCLVASLSYLTARLGGLLVLRPQMLWALWPGCALLVAVLLLTPRRLWPILLAAGLAGFVVYDAQAGLALRPTFLLIVSDAVEVLIAAFGVSYFFSGPVRLNSVRSLTRYSLFAVVLAPLAAAFIATAAFSGNYWIRWRIGFFTEALALLTVTPAILSWASVGRTWARKPRAFYLEATALIAGLGILGYVAFAAPKQISSPVLLYSLLPFLLWSALRFGLAGISTSMIVVALLSIWGAVHGRGPFTMSEPLTNVMSLQLFLFFSAATFMLLAVLMEEQKRTERSFRESEKRFRLVADTAPALIWMAGPDKLCTYFNTPWLDFTGRSMDSELGNGWAEGVHPEDLQKCMDTYIRSFDAREEFRMEYRLRRYDGDYRWVVDIGVPRFDQDRSFIGYIGIGIDITERKRAEEALTNVNRRLIEAQEKERKRIGRDLHDDIGQRLALLAVELEQLHREPPNLPQVRYRIGELHKQTSGIAADIQSLSHELHSSKLQYLGIAVAMRGFCREFGEQQKVEVDFKTQDLANNLSPDISLCLFRVLQEALHNSAKHSGARHFEVRLWGTPDEIRLTVSDSGVGFDREAARRGSGLGLISMEERLKLLNGSLAVETQPEKGTAVHARVPLSSGSDSMRAVG